MALLTADEMRGLERCAIESGSVSGLELMERAGQGVVDAILEEWPALTRLANAGADIAVPGKKRRAVVMCGPGHNGGDGFVVARLLHQRGWSVDVYLYGNPAKLPQDARTNFERWCRRGAVTDLTIETWENKVFPGTCDIVVDALFGIGLTRPIDLPLETLQAMPEVGQTHQVVAIDIPSGIDCDTGRCIDRLDDTVHPGTQTVPANLTVTFHQKKVGHMRGDGPRYCGKVIVKDIGL